MTRNLEVQVVVAVPATVDDEGNIEYSTPYLPDENPFPFGDEYEVWDQDEEEWTSLRDALEGPRERGDYSIPKLYGAWGFLDALLKRGAEA